MLAVSGAQVFNRVALIIRVRAFLEKAMSALATPVCLFCNRWRPLSTREKNGDYFNADSDATAYAVNVNNFWLINCLAFESPNTSLITASLIQAFYNLGFTLL